MLGSGTVTFGSGDEHIYRLRTDARRLSRRQRTVWRFRATRKPAEGQLVNWWEGNVTMGFGGQPLRRQHRRRRVLAHAARQAPLGPPGGQLGVVERGDRATTARVYFGSLDLTVRAVTPRGKLKWQKGAGNFVTSSPAIGRDGTVYIGSFDGALHALDPRTGAVRWRFETDDHVYASPALGPRLVYIASTDGSVYALDRGGRLRWRYDTGDTVRSSPVLGPRAARWRPDPLRGLLRRQPLRARRRDAAAGAGRTTRPRATRCCATATT